MFSKACEYGIRAVLQIAHASQSDRRMRLKEIAEAIDSPNAFTAKILQDLARRKIVKSLKGPTGGFEMTEEMRKNTSLSAVVDALDGDDVYNGCGIGLAQCDDSQPCPIHNKIKAVRENLKQVLEQTSIDELAKRLDSEKVRLK